MQPENDPVVSCNLGFVSSVVGNQNPTADQLRTILEARANPIQNMKELGDFLQNLTGDSDWILED